MSTASGELQPPWALYLQIWLIIRTVLYVRHIHSNHTYEEDTASFKFRARFSMSFEGCS